jgi:hypothetical protein
MFTVTKPHRPWSVIGLRILIGSIIAAVALAIVDGIFRGSLISNGPNRLMLEVWVADFRALADQAVYAATIFLVGAKFVETRTVFTVGFDKLDAAKMALKGPDEDNIVWVGHRYSTRMEAETVASAFAERLKESAVV